MVLQDIQDSIEEKENNKFQPSSIDNFTKNSNKKMNNQTFQGSGTNKSTKQNDLFDNNQSPFIKKQK